MIVYDFISFKRIDFQVLNLENDIRNVFIGQKLAKIEVLHEVLGPLSQKL